MIKEDIIYGSAKEKKNVGLVPEDITEFQHMHLEKYSLKLSLKTTSETFKGYGGNQKEERGFAIFCV